MIQKSHDDRMLWAQFDALEMGTGWEDTDILKPQIMIESVYGDSHPGSYHLNQMVEQAVYGVYQCGGKPAKYYATDICDGCAQGHDGMNVVLASREAIANMVEVHASAVPWDGMILSSSCDKSIPAHLKAAARMDIPAIFMPGGSMRPGPNMTTSLVAGDISLRQKRKDAITPQEVRDYKLTGCPSVGACTFLGTASTMQCMAEALGLTLPGAALVPATMRDLLQYSRYAGRKIMELVEKNIVDGWDDPRMPTLCGMRRRGYSPESIRKFIDSIGYTKFDALNDVALLEAAVRDDLNKKACRVSAVLDPVKLVITNYPDGETEEMEAINNPENEADGTHTITFSKELWIERADFMEDAPKKFFRLAPGREVRLKNAYIVKCTGCTKDAEGRITEIQAEYDPESKSGMAGANRRVKGTIHWVSASHCLPAEVREYDRLFCVENPSADDRDFRELLNPDSLRVNKGCYVEPYLAEKHPGDYLQFQRIGYLMMDLDSTADHLVFNKTVGLKDAWAKKQGGGAKK